MCIRDSYLVQFTRNGRVKKSALSEYRSADSSGLADLNLLKDDQVVAALLANGSGHYLVVASDGKTLRFTSDEVRASGRIGQGVQGMSLGKGSEVIAAFLIGEKDGRYLATLSSAGLAKRTSLDEFPARGRATGGVAAMALGPKDRLTSAAVVAPRDQMLAWTDGEDTARFAAKEMAAAARDRKGGRVPGIAKEQVAVGLARLPE